MALAARAEAEVRIAVDAERPGGGTDHRDIPVRTVQLHGPASVIGLRAEEIVRREPVPGAGEVEPNYFCFVELASPDLPWRYTPARPDGAGRLQPWLALVVVADRPGVSVAPRGGVDVLTVDDNGRELPPPTEVWAWAHVQVEADLDPADPDLEGLYRREPAAFRARLLCPRRLRPDRDWIACVVPTFEAGRLAGLGQPGTAATGLAWAATGSADLPVFDSWRFRTGPGGDFESLARRLTPRLLPAAVGLHDLDVSAPGAGLPKLPGAVISYEGALLSPAAVPRTLPPARQEEMEEALRVAVNGPPASRRPDPPVDAGYDPLVHDPVVRPPARGAFQAGRADLPGDREPPWWFDELNTEPQHRSVGAVGADTVRRDQERLMAAAWDAVRDLADVNRRLGWTRLAAESGSWLSSRVVALDEARLVQLMGPALARIPGDGATLLGELHDSTVPRAVATAAYRRVARPRTGVGTKLGVRAPGEEVAAAISADPDGPVVGFRRAVVPAGASVSASGGGGDSTVDPVADRDLPPFELLDRAVSGVLGGTVFGGTVFGGTVFGGTVFGGTVFGGTVFGGTEFGGTVVGGTVVTFDPEERPLVRLVRPGEAMTGEIDTTSGGIATTGGVIVSGGQPVLAGLSTAIAGHLDVHRLLGGLLREQVRGLTWSASEPVPARVWATPDFPAPLWDRVRALSVDYLVPGLGLVPDDTVGLLETNDAFVEAVLVGANNELSRELLWREYPARLGGTWFRQFWNSGSPDIEVISAWKGTLPLGGQDHSAHPDLVVLIKGRLPRRYPDLAVYAVEADWEVEDGRDVRRERKDGALRWPIFAGELEPGAVFYGFELDETTARGSLSTRAHPGWFFVLEERPRGARFGLDVGRPMWRGDVPDLWSDLTWAHVTPAGADDERVGFVELETTSWLAAAGPIEGNGGDDQWGGDAASMARVTLQRPMRVLFHAASMLPEGKA